MNTIEIILQILGGFTVGLIVFSIFYGIKEAMDSKKDLLNFLNTLDRRGLKKAVDEAMIEINLKDLKEKKDVINTRIKDYKASQTSNS